MTGAWQYPVHSHPWFRMPSHKRKAFEREDSSSSDYSDLERYAHPSKRLRCGILENGFAQLSLDAVNQFLAHRVNPNGCRPKMTYYTSLNYTNYTLVTDWFVQGNEIAVRTPHLSFLREAQD